MPARAARGRVRDPRRAPRTRSAAVGAGAGGRVEAAAASRYRCWIVAGVCALLAVPTAVDPDGGLASISYSVGLGLVVVALWWGAARWRGAARTGWRFVAAAASCWLVGDVLQRVLAAAGLFTEGVGPPDVFWLASYPLLIAAVAAMVGARGLTERVRREIRLDVTAVTAAAALGIWRVMIAPGLEGGTLGLTSVVATLYPLGDVAIFGMALTLLVAPGRRRGAGALLVACLASTLVLDTAFTVLPTAAPGFDPGRLDAVLLVVNSLLAVAVLHPDGGAVAEAVPTRGPALMHRSRVMLLGAALIAVSAAAALPYGKSSSVDRVMLLAAAGAVSVTVLARFYGVVRERERAEMLLTRSEARFRDLADHSPDLVLHFSRKPQLHIDYVSPSFEALTGIPAAAVQADLGWLAGAADRQTLYNLADAAAGRPLPPRFDTRVRRADGTDAILEVRVAETPDGIQGVGRDVTEIRALQAQLAEQATRDPLTGLANRRLLAELLDRALDRSRRAGTTITIAFLDLDGFKSVNDTYGHDAGDAVLRTTAARLQAAVRDADVVARYGGDEFVVVYETRGHGSSARIPRRIQQALDLPIDIGNGAVVSCPSSIGLADTDTTGRDADALITAADHAMLARKRQRSNRPVASAAAADPRP